MNTFFFGSSERQLFGAYHPPVASRARIGVILCYPFGKEYLRCHQSFRLLAQRIAECGCHVLRFDYYGTGDSAGLDTEVDVDLWSDDIRWAADELKDMAGVSKIALVGLRLGASVALTATKSRSDVERLVLWDPICDGRAYVDDLVEHPRSVASSKAYGSLESDFGGKVVDALGFPMTPMTRRAIQDTNVLGNATAPLPPTLLITTQSNTAELEPLRKTLESADATTAWEKMSGPMVWVQEEEDDFGASGMPVDVLNCIAEWVSS